MEKHFREKLGVAAQAFNLSAAVGVKTRELPGLAGPSLAQVKSQPLSQGNKTGELQSRAPEVPLLASMGVGVGRHTQKGSYIFMMKHFASKVIQRVYVF